MAQEECCVIHHDLIYRVLVHTTLHYITLHTGLTGDLNTILQPKNASDPRLEPYFTYKGVL